MSKMLEKRSDIMAKMLVKAYTHFTPDCEEDFDAWACTACAQYATCKHLTELAALAQQLSQIEQINERRPQ